MRIPINSFTGGAVSPLLVGRTDLESLKTAAVTMDNFLPMSTGGVVRRPSLLQVATSDTLAAEPPAGGDPSVHSRLIPFTYNVDTLYQIQLSQSWFKVWRKDGSLAFSGDILPDSLAGLWPTLGDFDIDAISYLQVNNVLILAHSAFPPLIITRVTDTDWSVGSLQTSTTDDYTTFWPPFLDEQATSEAASDAVEGFVVSLASFSATRATDIIGGFYSAMASPPTQHGPCPATWRLYTTLTGFSGTIKIQGCDTSNGTFVDIPGATKTYTTVTQAITMAYEWFHKYYYLKVNVTRSAGTAVVELRHLGSTAAPTFWIAARSSGTFKDIYSSPPAFADYSRGEALQIGHLRRDNLVDFILSATTAVSVTSTGLFIFGAWEAYSTGIWNGAIFLEAKDSTGRWDVIRTWSGNKDYNFSASGTEVPGRLLRLRAEITSAAAASGTSVYPRFSLKATDGILYQWGRVDDNPANTTSQMRWQGMNGQDLQQLSYATTLVSRGAFSVNQGYPSAVCIHDERVYLGGTAKRPTTIWASGVNDLFNFRRTGFDDGGFMFQLAANEGNPIQSMVSASRGVVLMTAGDEWLIDGADTGVTPTNINARRQSRYGSAPIQALPCAGSLIFVQRSALALRDYQYDWASQAFDSPDLTDLVRHLTGSGLRAFAYSQSPEPMLWVVLKNGSLLTCTYNKKQRVVGWARHPTSGGLFESVSVVPGSSAQADDVWFIVQRNGRRRIEKLDSAMWASLYDGTNFYHLDGAVKKTGAAFTSVTGLGHLEGLTVQIIANDVVQTPAVVASGAVAVPAGTTSALVGLSFASLLQSMPFDVPLQDGTLNGRQVTTPTFALRLHRTRAGGYADSPTGQVFPLKLPSTDFTGVMQAGNLASIRDVYQMTLGTSSPLPLNILAVVPNVVIYG